MRAPGQDQPLPAACGASETIGFEAHSIVLVVRSSIDRTQLKRLNLEG
jgi:hypothetical protein